MTREERSRAGVSPGRVLAAVLGWPALAFFLLQAPAFAFLGLVLAVCGLAAWELLGLFALAGPRRVFALALAVGLCASSASGQPALFVVTLAAASVILGTSILFLRFRDLREGVDLAGAAAAGMLYVGMPLGLLVLMRRARDGLPVAALLVLGTWARDMGAYVGGRLLRGRALRGDINPHKHLPGAISGLAAATLAVVGLDRILGRVLDPVELAALALVIGIFGQAGDLFESLLKRQAGARHSGQVLAEQGGVLDSVDGLLFTVPAAQAALYAVRWILYAWRG